MRAAERRAYETATERADGRCEGCGEYAPLNRHHRRFRSRGGKTITENIAMLCGMGNASGCHGRAHGPNPPAGWAISRYEEKPDHLVPFESFDGPVWLTKDGRRVPVDDPAETPF